MKSVLYESDKYHKYIFNKTKILISIFFLLYKYVNCFVGITENQTVDSSSRFNILQSLGGQFGTVLSDSKRSSINRSKSSNFNQIDSRKSKEQITTSFQGFFAF